MYCIMDYLIRLRGANPRKKDELCEDLKDLLSTFVGYLPHSIGL